jgi:hypothetical protein
MREVELPPVVSKLIDNLQIVQLDWHGITIQLPKFAVYAVLENPVFDKYFYRNGRKMGLIRFGRYHIPVLDPLRRDLQQTPNFVVIVSHSRDNLFGLYAYPADKVNDSIEIPYMHRAVNYIVKDFV